MTHFLLLLVIVGITLCPLVQAEDTATRPTTTVTAVAKQGMASSPIAHTEPVAERIKNNRLFTVSMFLVIIAVSGAILIWAAGRNRTAEDYYTAGGGISGLLNGWALAGDTLSASTFLGASGLIALYGLDGFMYVAGPTVSFLTILLIIAEPCRNVGKYTLGDILSFRSSSKVVRGSAALSTVILTSFFLLVQMVGAGKLMQLLLGVPYDFAVIGVGAVIVLYVSLGGMKATTLVQIIKAALLLGTSAALSIAVLWKFSMNPVRFLDAIATNCAIQDHTRTFLKYVFLPPDYDYGQRFLEMGLLLKDPVEMISLSMAIILGVAGMPHIMMRFFTVPNAKEARRSVVIAIGLIAIFLFLITFLGLGAALFISPQKIMSVDKGGNVSILMLAQFIGGGVGSIGGDLLLAFICAVAFATILAVVSGTVLASSAAISHDLYVHIIKNGKADQKEQVIVAKLSAFLVGAVVTLLAMACENENVVILATLCYAVAASSNLPVILFSLFLKRFNTAGIVSGLSVGTFLSISLVMVSPNMKYPKIIAADAKKIAEKLETRRAAGVKLTQEEAETLETSRREYNKYKDGKSAIGLDAPLFPLKNPGVVSIPIGFAVTILASLLFRNHREEKMFHEMYVRQNTGYRLGETVKH